MTQATLIPASAAHYPTPEEVAATKIQFLADARRNIAACRAKLDQIEAGRIPDCFVAMYPAFGGCLQYTEDGAGRYQKPRHVTADNATTFASGHQAARVCALTYNGADEQPTPVQHSHALIVAIANYTRLVALIESVDPNK